VSFVISRSVAAWTVRIAAPLALAFAGSGLRDIVTLPQPSNPEFYQRVADSALQGTIAPRKDKSAAVTGMIKILFGAGAIAPLAMMQRSLDATKLKLSKQDKPYTLVARRHAPDEWAKDEDKTQVPRHKTEEYQAIVAPVVEGAAKVVQENQWTQNLLACPVVICVGLGGSGKSRSASAIAILKMLFQNSLGRGADTKILDPQMEANQFASTWVSGELHDLDTIADTQEEVLRTKAGARHLVTIFDEVASWFRDYLLKDYMAAAIVHAGETVRKTNQSHIFVCQKLEDFGSKDVFKLFDSAEIVYFLPEQPTPLGETPRSRIVAIKRRNAVYSAYKEGNKDWTLHNVPEDLDPSAFEQRIGQDLAELKLGAIEIRKAEANANSNGKVNVAEFIN